MAEIIRGVETAEVRMRLSLQSEDAPTHSIMTDNMAQFKDCANDIAQYARGKFQNLLAHLRQGEKT
jgi:hypothetical protein